MARQKVEKVQCDRCKRVELQPIDQDPSKRLKGFHAVLGNLTIDFPDLCIGCRRTLENVWPDLKEWDREVKYTVITTGPKILGENAAPANVAPDYTPPKPHSAEAGKR